MAKTLLQIDRRGRLIGLTIMSVVAAIAIFIYTMTWQQRNAYRDELLAEVRSYRTLIAQIPGPVCRLEARTGRIVTCNTAFARLCGRERGDLVGGNLISLLPEEYVNQHDGYFTNWEGHWKQYGNRTTTIPNAAIVRPDGITVHFVLQISPVDYGGWHEWICFVNPLTIELENFPSPLEEE